MQVPAWRFLRPDAHSHTQHSLLPHQRKQTQRTDCANSEPIETANWKSPENKDHTEMVTGKSERPIVVETMTTKRLGFVFIVTAHMVLNGKTYLMFPNF